MKKEVFHEIISDNMNSTLVSVTLSGGIRLGQSIEIDGNRTTRTNISFAKLEDSYVAVRKHTEVSYDYSGQSRNGDSRNDDYYLGYEEIIAIEFFDTFQQQIDNEARKNAEKEKQKARDEERRQNEENRAKMKKNQQIFVESEGGIG